MKNKKYYRVSEAASELGVSPVTIRAWTNAGKLECEYSPAGQRIYKVSYIEEIKNQHNPEPETPREKIYYARSSSGDDVTIQTQLDKLIQAYGEPDKTFTDKGSGLNEKRPGLNNLIKHMNTTDTFTLYITNKDRLTRFGLTYLEEIIHLNNGELTILDDDTTKEPQEVLLQDFMSLLASFSGKFYRLRGLEQRKRFLNDVQKRVNNHEPQ